VFFDNVPTAVEVAIKVALQFFLLTKAKTDNHYCFRKCISWRYFCSYGSKRNLFTQAFEECLIWCIPAPTCERQEQSYDALRAQIKK
jgi:hypothetical protein